MLERDLVGLGAAWGLLLDRGLEVFVEKLADLQPVGLVGHALDGVGHHDVLLLHPLLEIQEADHDLHLLDHPEVGQHADAGVPVPAFAQRFALGLELDERVLAFVHLGHVDAVQPAVALVLLVYVKLLDLVRVLVGHQLYDFVQLEVFARLDVLLEVLNNLEHLLPLRLRENAILAEGVEDHLVVLLDLVLA